MLAVASVLALAWASSALADPSPLTPATGIEGGPCLISWTPDTTGTWTETNIELMTGSNQAMIHLTTVATIDTTSAAATTYTWTCPEVTVTSAIYFYQFSHASAPTDLLWTTRWGIAGPNGTLVPPANQVQPDSTQDIPWGIGYLVDESAATVAPSYITGETSAGNVTAVVSAATGSATASSGAVASAVSTTSSSSPTMQVVTVTATSKASAATESSTKSSTVTNGAESVKAHGAAFSIGALALAAGFLLA